MEYYEEGDLWDKTIINKHCIDIVLYIAKQILDALIHCHQNDVMHRDLKTDNILVTNFPDIVLADFGFCSINEPSYMLCSHPGSPAYAAPELYTGTPYRGDKADIWAFGVIIHNLLEHKYPFSSPNRRTLSDQVRFLEVFPEMQELPREIPGDPESEDWIRQNLRQLIRWCLSKDPRNRPTAIEALNHHVFSRFFKARQTS